MFTPHLLRLLGAKIGRNVEVSTVMHVVPDLVEMDDGSFLADACMVGGPRIHRGWVDVAANKIGSRSFVGNSAFAPSGVELGNQQPCRSAVCAALGPGAHAGRNALARLAEL